MTNYSQKKYGITIVELMVGMVISLVVILGAGLVMADGIRGFKAGYDSANGPVAIESYTAQKSFDRIVRKCSYLKYPVAASDGSTLDTYYISDPGYYKIDRRAHFYVDSSTNELKVTHYVYPLPSSGTGVADTEVLCENVSLCKLKAKNRSCSMTLKLSADSKEITTSAAAYLHN